MRHITLRQGQNLIDGVVFIEHIRTVDSRNRPQPKGGVTRVVITLDDGYVTQGQANCSLQDNFSRRLGRTIALGRALKKLRNHGYTLVMET